MVKMETETSPSEQKTQPGARSNLIEQRKCRVTSSNKQMQDSLICAASNSDNIDHQSIKQEKVATDADTKTEVVPTDQQGKFDMSHLETKSNKIKQEKVATDDDLIDVGKTKGVPTQQQGPDARADLSHLQTNSNEVKLEKAATDEEMKTEVAKTQVVRTEQQTPDVQAAAHLATKSNEVKQEKVATDGEMETVVAPSTQQKSDLLVDSSHLEAKSNGHERPGSECQLN